MDHYKNNLLLLSSFMRYTRMVDVRKIAYFDAIEISH